MIFFKKMSSPRDSSAKLDADKEDSLAAIIEGDWDRSAAPLDEQTSELATSINQWLIYEKGENISYVY